MALMRHNIEDLGGTAVSTLFLIPFLILTTAQCLYVTVCYLLHSCVISLHQDFSEQKIQILCSVVLTVSWCACVLICNGVHV